MTLELTAAAILILAALALVSVIMLFLLGSRLKAMHQEMIDTHETLKRKHQL